MSDYKATIGLEIHAELKTNTKMFCNSKNDLDEEKPNVHVCPVCLGHPGTLPVINKQAVEHVLRVGVAAGGTLADFTEFDRKNYFYPDIPKGYQISQYAYPLVSGGSIAGVALTRIHLEEDTAKSTHTDDGSLVDFNRAGVPLLELVTEPVIHSAEEAVSFAKELRLLLRYLGVSDANMEKGHMRVEVNISVSKDDILGTKTEIKNLNSFGAVEGSIRYEIERQTKAYQEGEDVVQETRGWDENKQSTFSQRKKESSHDYRYFPDPDLPKLKISDISEWSETKLKESLPELPWEKRVRYIELGITEENVEMFVGDSGLGGFFDDIITEFGDKRELLKLAANYTTSDLVALRQEEDFHFPSPKHFAALMTMIEGGELSSRGGKDVLAHMVKQDEDPQLIAEREGLLQQSDTGELTKIVEQIIAENEKAVKEYKKGNENSIQFLIGQGMKVTKGSANPQVLKELFVQIIDK